MQDDPYNLAALQLPEEARGLVGEAGNRFNDAVINPIDQMKYAYAANNPMKFIDPYGLWYLDFNYTFGFIGGITYGFQIGGQGIYLYAGWGATSGYGFSFTWSPYDSSACWQSGYAVYLPKLYIGGQVGYLTPPNPQWDTFREIEISLPAGIRAMLYRTFELWRWGYEPEEFTLFHMEMFFSARYLTITLLKIFPDLKCCNQAFK